MTYAIGATRRNGVEITEDGDPIALVYGESYTEARVMAERILTALTELKERGK